MNPTEERLVITEGVLLIPVSELTSDIRSRLNLQGGEYAISRPGTRSTTQVIDSDAAALLQEFRTPKTVAQAVDDYCRRYGQDPSSMLGEALPFIERLAVLRVLAPPEDQPAPTGQPSFKNGDQIDGHEILEAVRIFEDTEIYRVSGPQGGSLALKIVRPGARTEFLRREAAALSRLGGNHIPKLWETGSYQGRAYLLMEWCQGDSAYAAAEHLRSAAEGISAGLLDLCLSILEAYADLHRQGVIHGDIHPHNLLVSEQGEVMIIDFGLSRLEGVEPDPEPPLRGGISFYFEPEYARALLDGSLAPAASPRGEQYALAALLYLLLQAKPYLDFSLERETALRQILQDDPVPFRGEQAGAVEKVLRTALSKDPWQRFASLDDFSSAMRFAALEMAGQSMGNLQKPQAALESAQFGEDKCPTAYHGSAGMAYGFYRAACLKDDSHLLALAEKWSLRAGWTLARYPELAGNASSLYQGACGIYTVQALVSHAQNDPPRVQKGLEHFNAAAGQAKASAALDLITGKAGTLLACSLLLETLGGSQEIDVSALRQTGNRLLGSLWGEISGLGSIREARQVPYLGMAHGWAGLLYALMRWVSVVPEAASSEVLRDLSERLGQLSELRIPSSGGACWPLNPQSKEPPWAGWCHGSAGYIHLWALAYHLYRRDEFLELARQAGEYTWSHPHPTASLCCGLAGQVYGLLHLYKLLAEREWLERAHQLYSMIAAVGPLSHTNSLYQGDAGPALLAFDLANLEWSAMPLFEAEGW